jgi:SPP1 gp7 family putative phage head morphogenesis protein
VIGDFVSGLFPTGTEAVDFEAARRIEEMLNDYGRLLGPWAESVGRRMLEEVSRRDAGAWSELGRELGIGLRREIERASTGLLFQEVLAAQVGLIRSIPLEAADRVHHLATEALVTGARAKEIANEIMNTGEVSQSRANTIARTETSRASSIFSSTRAQYLGSTHFQWMTAGDRDVRPLHKKLDGKVFAWNDPPIIGENGERGLPGTIYNCRCVALPIVPAHFFESAAA